MKTEPERSAFGVLSIRQRIFVAILLPATLLLVTSLVVVFLQVRNDRLQDLDRELQARTLAVVGMTEFGLAGWSLEIDFHRDRQSDLLRPLIDWRLQVYPCGEILAQSSAAPASPCDAAERVPTEIPPVENRPAAIASSASSVTVQGVRVRQWSGLYVVRGDVDGDDEATKSQSSGDLKPNAVHAPGILQATVTQELGPLEAGLMRLVVRLATLGALLLALAALIAQWLARAIAAPIERMASSVDAIVEPGPEPLLNDVGRDDEIGRLAHALNAAFLRSHAAMEQQKQFAANASHELRTPLSAIRAGFEIALSRERERDAYKEVIEDALVSTLRIQKIVEGLLLLARTDGRRPLTTSMIDVATFVHDVVDGISAPGKERLRIGQLDAISIDVDDMLWEQALRNLIDNAIAHTAPNGEVTVTATVTDAAVVFAVRDTGPGIAAEHLDRVFDRFYRTDASRDRHRGGAGLGLSITRAIVERHGGTIGVESEVGAGTTFTIRLPRR